MPSGTLWATCNIGASRPEETGLYFAWGETSGYTVEQVGVDKNFIQEDYEFGPETAITKYNRTDGKTILDTSDDAAFVNLGSNWRMPTIEQFYELIANTDYEWSEINDIQGVKFTSKVDADKFLFLPATGKAENGGVDGVGGVGDYWSVSLNDDEDSCAWILDFFDSGCETSYTSRYIGLSVRPVRV